MNIENLKERARAHEWDEEWGSAIALYQQALDSAPPDRPADTALYNRVGDLQVRIGDIDGAIENYLTSVDLYLDAELPNAAIAVCRKILRNAPTRAEVFLRMGQIRAAQGFLTDARQNFLTYAERKQRVGDLEEAFRSLVEFVELAPEDVETRRALADRLLTHDRSDAALEQYRALYFQLLRTDQEDAAEEVEGVIRGIDPDADLEASSAPPGWDELRDEQEGGEDADEGVFELPTPDVADAQVEGGLLGGFEATALVEAPLPAQEMDGLEDDDDWMEGVRLVSDAAAADPPDDPGSPGPGVEEASTVATSVDTQDEVAPLEPHEALAAEGDWIGAGEALAPLIEEHPLSIELRQRAVEYAFRSHETARLADAYLGLAQALHESGEVEKSRAVFRQVLSVDPGNGRALEAVGESDERPGGAAAPSKEVVSSEDYVDLGALILGEEGDRSTRWKVEAAEPSGDEEADFADMLGQFKAKVAAHLDVDDIRAHYDLGTAYKDMGLLDEAISEFQMALRADGRHLPTYEVLGEAFLDKGEPQATIRALDRAVRIPHDVEDELLGIYYYLGRAHEELGNRDSAREFYERTFALDINFRDVTERLRQLR